MSLLLKGDEHTQCRNLTTCTQLRWKLDIQILCFHQQQKTQPREAGHEGPNGTGEFEPLEYLNNLGDGGHVTSSLHICVGRQEERICSTGNPSKYASIWYLLIPSYWWYLAYWWLAAFNVSMMSTLRISNCLSQKQSSKMDSLVVTPLSVMFLITITVI